MEAGTRQLRGRGSLTLIPARSEFPFPVGQVHWGSCGAEGTGWIPVDSVYQRVGWKQGEWTQVSQRDPGCPRSKLSPELPASPTSAFPGFLSLQQHVRQHEGPQKAGVVAGTITPPSLLVIPLLHS